MKLLITGDLVINQSYDASDKIDQGIIDLFFQSECNIVNLEAPVTDSESKILKTGPHLKSDKQCTLDVMKKLNIHIAALANNHIKDYDEEGVLDTIKYCKDNGFETVGAGRNLAEACATKVLTTSAGNIALINIAENEWSSAEENSAGANGMDLIKDVSQIQLAKENNDFVVVIIHGGHEYYNLPSPRMKNQYRFYAEQGADLVVGHHTHCLSGYEIHCGTPIYYSLGNFLFTNDSMHEDWYKGGLLEVNILNGKLDTSLHPLKQTENYYRLSLLQGKEKDNALAIVEEYSKIITDNDKLLEHWYKFVLSEKNIYLNYWSPLSFIKSRYIAGFLRRSKIKMFNKKGLALYLNLMRCEAHHDLSIESLKEYL